MERCVYDIIQVCLRCLCMESNNPCMFCSCLQALQASPFRIHRLMRVFFRHCSLIHHCSTHLISRLISSLISKKSKNHQPTNQPTKPKPTQPSTPHLIRDFIRFLHDQSGHKGQWSLPVKPAMVQTSSWSDVGMSPDCPLKWIRGLHKSTHKLTNKRPGVIWDISGPQKNEETMKNHWISLPNQSKSAISVGFFDARMLRHAQFGSHDLIWAFEGNFWEANVWFVS